MLEENIYVVCFFSCMTALSERKYRKKNRRSKKDSSNSKDETVSEQIFCPGMSLWIVFNWPEFRLAAFEEYISKEILAAGLGLRSCKAVRGRGSSSLSLMYIFESCDYSNSSKNLSNFYILGTKNPNFQSSGLVCDF